MRINKYSVNNSVLELEENKISKWVIQSVGGWEEGQ